MCAYNSINGEPACANQFLLQHTLRGAWNFQGYVVSDCGAVRDIFNGHHFRANQPQASAIALERGMDNECIDSVGNVPDDHDYKPYIEAVQQGYLSERAVDTALIRLFSARVRLGMFDPPAKVPYANIDESELDSAAHRRLAGRLADESIVLLKNDGVLPLKTTKRITIVGPLAQQTAVLLGNYSGSPTHTVSMLEGMKASLPEAKITYVPGTQFLSNQGDPVPASVLTTVEGKPGLLAEYGSGFSIDSEHLPFTARVEETVDLNEKNMPEQANGKPRLAVRWSGFLNARATGDYLLGIRTDGFARVSLGDKTIVQMYGPGANTGRVHLEQGRRLALQVQYSHSPGSSPEAQLIWVRANDAPDPAAVAAAKQADVVIAVVGITSRLEGEEMPVDQPGFLGGDRTNLEMPEPEQDLVRALAAAHKPLVVVLLNGSALGVNWEKEHADAIVEAWYPGEEGGAAIARTLSGKNNPGGRLPVTFYKGVNQLPPFEDYSMKGRTYRYFAGEPLWPFGYGLSYTKFSYSGLALSDDSINAGDSLKFSVTVTNTGSLAGDEVVQLYLKFPSVQGAPIRALRGFERVHLTAGGSRNVAFALNPRDLSMVTASGDTIVAPGSYEVSIGGGQPGTAAPSVSASFDVRGQIMLPE
jgi:beta-glucosidase